MIKNKVEFTSWGWHSDGGAELIEKFNKQGWEVVQIFGDRNCYALFKKTS